MRYTSLKEFIAKGTKALKPGPVALIFVEDEIEIGSTLKHHLNMGFAEVIALMPAAIPLPGDLTEAVIRVDSAVTADGAVPASVNRVIEALPNRWFYYGFNAEYLFFPFCETRSIGEMLEFHSSERRNAMVTFVIDLYAEDLNTHPLAVDLNTAHLDRSAYYAAARHDPSSGAALDRQLDFHGGLRWRFEEHIPSNKRKIDRVGIFKSKPGLRLRNNHTFSDEEYNTYSCPWHHNLSAAICSFRIAKALKRNPGSSFDIQNFKWWNSVPFEWDSRQLLDLGLIEPGQWF